MNDARAFYVPSDEWKIITEQREKIAAMEAENTVIAEQAIIIEGMRQKLKLLNMQVRAADLELQQWEDETDLEIAGLDDIIEGQKEHIKQLKGFMTFNQHSFEICLAEKAEIEKAASKAYATAARVQAANVDLLDENQALEAKLEWIRKNTPLYWDMLEEAMTQAEDPRRSAPTPPNASVDWTTAPRWANYHAFDESKVGWWYKNEPVKDYEFSQWRQSNTGGELLRSSYTLPDGTKWEKSITQRPQQGETVPPRPMWSRYRRFTE